MEILIYPDSRLRQKSEPVTVFDDSLKQIVKEMLKLMHSKRGVGLAAPQVGILKNLIINHLYYDDKENPREPVVMVNPKIIERRGTTFTEEGCLSTPEIYASVERDQWLKVEFQDLDGNIHQIEVENFRAKMVLHEMDHLEGKLFWDYLGLAQRNLLIKKLKKSLK